MLQNATCTATLTDHSATTHDTPSIDDIKAEYHAGSGKPTTIHSFETFGSERPKVNVTDFDGKPWCPFGSRADFEFAEIIHDAHMSRDAVNRLLKLMGRVTSGEDQLSFSSYNDVQQAWSKASLFYPMVCV
jgi:hypothetical protein